MVSYIIKIVLYTKLIPIIDVEVRTPVDVTTVSPEFSTWDLFVDNFTCVKFTLEQIWRNDTSSNSLTNYVKQNCSVLLGEIRSWILTVKNNTRVVIKDPSREEPSQRTL